MITSMAVMSVFRFCIFLNVFVVSTLFGLPVSQTMGFATVAGGGSKQGKG